MKKYLPAILSALVVVVLAAAYGAFILLALDDVDVTNGVRIVIAIVVLFVTAGVGWALISRVREIKQGVEDDLGKY